MISLCNRDCNHCPIITHPNSRMLTAVLNALLDEFGEEVYPIVQNLCPNMTVCYDCRIDDFVHLSDCPILDQLDKEDAQCPPQQ